MEETTKIVLGYGLSGAINVIAAWAIYYLWRENRKLTERLIGKAERDALVNKQTANEVITMVGTLAKSLKPIPRKATRRLDVGGDDNNG